VKILLIKLGHLGDTLLLTPALDFLAQKFPGLRLDVMVRSGCEVMLQGHPAITNLIPIARPEKTARTFGRSVSEFRRAFRLVFAQRYDYAFALTESDRAVFWVRLSGAKVRVINDAYQTLKWKRRWFNRVTDFAWAREHQVLRDFRTMTDVLQPEAQPGPLRFYPQADYPQLCRKLPFLESLGDLVIIHPASRWAFKQWLPERWAAVADDIRKRHGWNVVFSTGPAPRELECAQAILSASRERHFSTQGKATLHEIGLLLGRAKLFLGVDTAVMHLAAAMQTPSVVLFGPSSEWSWHPWQCRHEMVLGECSCKTTRQFVCDKSKPYPCMEKITVDAVVASANKLLAPP
jgi:heptosyltransferase-3